MFKEFKEVYHFISKFKENDLKKLSSKVSIIFRNYEKKIDIVMLKKIKSYCAKNNRKFYLANNIKLAIYLGLDGAYIPSYNKDLKHNSYSLKKKFRIIGSAHNRQQIYIKERQQADAIFLSPIFKMETKKHMGIYRFLFLQNLTKRKTIALGGINHQNIKKIKMLKTYGFAGISYFKNNKII